MSEHGIVVFLSVLAAIISLITGLIAGVTFSGIIIRLLISSFLFALLGFGITLIIKNFLPELFEDNEIQNETDEPQMKSGQNIDVVLPDENPHEELNKELSAANSELNKDLVEEESSGPDSLEDDVDSNSGFVEEVSELENEASLEEETSEEIDSPKENLQAVIEEPEDNAGGALPNIDSFSDSFSETINTTSVNEEIKKMDSSKIDAKMELLGLEKDTGTMAKAVQTFLKKDQEGN